MKITVEKITAIIAEELSLSEAFAQPLAEKIYKGLLDTSENPEAGD